MTRAVEESPSRSETERLETFSDGVFETDIQPVTPVWPGNAQLSRYSSSLA